MAEQVPGAPKPHPTASKPRRSRWRWAKRSAIALVSLIVVLGVLTICAPTLLSAGLAKSYLEAQLRKSIADPLSIKSVSVTWSGPQVIKGLRIELPDSGGNASTVDIEIDNSLSELWSMDEADIVASASGEFAARIDPEGNTHFINFHPVPPESQEPFTFPMNSIDMAVEGVRFVVFDQRSQREHILNLDDGLAKLSRSGTLEFRCDGAVLAFGAGGGFQLSGSMHALLNTVGVLDLPRAQLTGR